MKKIIKTILLSFNVVAVLLLLLAYLAPVVNPNVSVIPSYMGLLFLYIVAVNIFFIVIWISMTKWYFLISLFVLLSGYKVLNRSIPYRTNETTLTTPGAVKVMSYNVRVFNRYGWQEKGTPQDVADFVKSENPDILCLQEFGTNSSDKNRSEKAILKLFKSWKYHHFQYGPAGNKGFKQGLAIFSKYHILRTGLLPNGDTDNFTFYADIDVHDEIIRVFNCHLKSVNMSNKEYWVHSLIKNRSDQEKIKRQMGVFRGTMNEAYKKRAIQANTHNEYIKSSPFPVVVCGDFNDTPVSYTYRKIKEDLVDAYCDSGNGIGSTYNGNYPLLRIDYIMFDKRLSSNDFKRHKVKLSDHFPVSCFIEFNN